MAESRDTKRYRKLPRSRAMKVQDETCDTENDNERKELRKSNRQNVNFDRTKEAKRPKSSNNVRSSSTERTHRVQKDYRRQPNYSTPRSVEVNGCRPKEFPTKRPNSRIYERFGKDGLDGFKKNLHDFQKPRDTYTDSSYEHTDTKRMTMGFPFLKGLIGKDPPYIVIELTKRKNVLQECILRTTKEPAFLEIFLDVIAEAYKSKTTPNQIIGLFEALKEGDFFNAVAFYLLDLSPKIEDENVDIAKTQKMIKNLLLIAKTQLQRNPSSLFVLIRMYTTINQVVEGLNKLGSLDEDVVEDLLQFKEMKKHSESERRNTKSESRPPDDFRSYPVSPCKAELLCTCRPFLRQNVVQGQYDDLNHYLDVQYRLLREDFVGPLREGLIAYINSKSSNASQQGDTNQRLDIKIYENVIIHSPVLTNDGLCYKLQIHFTNWLRRINWEQSKRLIYGSLVCLSDIDRDEFYIATVVDRDDIESGLLTVQFVNELLSTRELINRHFSMAESSAYYESYKHVLSGMQSLQPGDLPFEEYILGKNVCVSRPVYLSRQTTYDLRTLVDQNYVVHSEGRLRNIGTVVRATTTHFSAKSKTAKSIQICNLDSWPSNELLNLDESQYRAVQSALTKEFAIVQGPPGTGKTYIGLQIAKILLHNRSVWSGSGTTVQPMLIVCYTNHALDQFLEGIVKFFKGDVLRIGGRCKSETLKNLNIKEFRRERHGPRTPIGIMQRNKKQAMEELKEKMKIFSEIARTIDLYRSEIIHERALKVVMGRHYHSLVNGMPNGKKTHYAGSSFSYLFKWLGLAEIMRACRHEAQEQESKIEKKNKKCISVKGEAEHRFRTAFVNVSEDILYGLDEGIVKAMRSKVIAFHADSNVPTKFKNEKEASIERHYRKLLRSRLSVIISDVDIMSAEEAAQITKVWHLNQQTRWRLYRLWVQMFCAKEYERVDAMKTEFEEVSERFQEAVRQEDKEIMKRASVIGMTTSGAARYQAVLKEVGPKIVIVEEAAEVLETHIAMSLSKSCQHLILIGDHKQLRPNPNVYHLAKRYNLDISLFERMVKAGMEFSCLKLQHRMRPEISSIVRHIYHDLCDHQTVEKYPAMKGISTNLHLINHDQPETRDGDGKSYSNPHEAMYAIALCRFLFLQGYARHQITILTTYTAQLFFMRNHMSKNDFKGVNVTVVDNYQGEENDIVILSLVRSNKEDKIGFMKTENRICVALSRAKMGFYILGNFNHLAMNSQLWKNVTDDMRERGHLSDCLKLYCQNHPKDKGIEAFSANDFSYAPEGGCRRICDARLNCGHKCERYCHILDPDHDEYKCRKPCTKKCENAGHPCKAECYKECPPCPVKVTKTVPSCLHEQKMKCSMDPKRFICLMPCESTLPCGHRCTNVCGDPHIKKCSVVVEHTWPCGHTGQVHCWETKTKKCPIPCNTILMCEHKCEGTCGSCLNGRLHQPCRIKCRRSLVCGHECGSYCNMCLPCKEKCRNRCIHSKCTHQCGKLCQPCKEPCAWRCKHYRCKKLCFEVCDRPKCNKPCPKKIESCKHSCIGLCGEPCPKLCRICNKDEVTEILFGHEDDPGSRFVLLEDCNHIIEYKAMDKYMSVEDNSIKLKCCPKCSTPIQKSLRYGNKINEVLRNIERVKIEMQGNIDNITSIWASIQKDMKEPYSYRRLRSSDLRLMSCRKSIKFLVEFQRMKSELLTEHKVISFQNQLRMADALFKAQTDIKKERPNVPTQMVDDLLSFQSEIIDLIIEPTDWLTEQQILDFTLELKRCRLFVQFCKVLNQLKKANKLEESVSDIEHIQRVLLVNERFDEEKQETVIECTKNLIEMTKIDGLGITEEERLDIVKAVGLSQGHWFKCPNNHIYAIGECGGADEHGKCPECNADIGGERHRLAEGNTVASEMDGARFAAYSEEANNMANFDLDNLF